MTAAAPRSPAWVPATILAGASGPLLAPGGEGGALLAGWLGGLLLAAVLPEPQAPLRGTAGFVPRAVFGVCTVLLLGAQLLALAPAAQFVSGAGWTGGVLLGLLGVLAAVALPRWAAGGAAVLAALLALGVALALFFAAPGPVVRAARPAGPPWWGVAATAGVVALGTAALVRGAAIPVSRGALGPVVLVASVCAATALLAARAAATAASGAAGASFAALPGWLAGWALEGAGGLSWVEAVDRDGDGLLGAGELILRAGALLPAAPAMAGLPFAVTLAALAALGAGALWAARALLVEAAAGAGAGRVLRPAIAIGAAALLAWRTSAAVADLAVWACALAAPLAPSVFFSGRARAGGAAAGALLAAAWLAWSLGDPQGLARAAGGEAAAREAARLVLAAPGENTAAKARAQASLAAPPAEAELAGPVRVVATEGGVAVRVFGLGPAAGGLLGLGVAVLVAAFAPPRGKA